MKRAIWQCEELWRGYVITRGVLTSSERQEAVKTSVEAAERFIKWLRLDNYHLVEKEPVDPLEYSHT